MQNVNAKNIDEYIAAFPPEIQKKMKQIRSLIKKLIPKVEESISYQIPTFKINGKHVVYFAAYKNFISVYPAPRENPEFKKELSQYEGGKGTVQFPHDQPIPLDLVKRIIQFRAAQTAEKTKSKAR